MLLKMKTSLCGPELSLAAGDEHDFEDAEAKRLIKAGHAVVVKSETPSDRVARLEKELAEAKAAVKA